MISRFKLIIYNRTVYLLIGLLIYIDWFGCKTEIVDSLEYKPWMLAAQF